MFVTQNLLSCSGVRINQSIEIQSVIRPFLICHYWAELNSDVTVKDHDVRIWDVVACLFHSTEILFIFFVWYILNDLIAHMDNCFLSIEKMNRTWKIVIRTYCFGVLFDREWMPFWKFTVLPRSAMFLLNNPKGVMSEWRSCPSVRWGELSLSGRICKKKVL